MKKLFMIAAALALAACAKEAQRPALAKVGAPAPEVKVERFVRGDLKQLASWRDLKGKAVVLEFWDTGCHPCTANIPHMNELVEKFKDKPVVFIQVSKEKEGTVTEFLKDHDMHGNIAAEAGAAFKAFKIFGIPHAALIDKDGVFRGGLHPAGLKAETIDDLLAGKPIQADAEEEEEPGDDGDTAEARNLAFFSIAPGGDKPDLRYGGNSFQADGITLDYAIETALAGTHGVEFVNVHDSLKNLKVKVTARAASVDGEDDGARLRELVVSGMNAALPLKITLVRKEKKVYLLKRDGAIKPGLAKAAGAGGSRKMNHGPDGAYMEAQGASISTLAEELEDWLGVPVLDETGLNGSYNFRVEVKEVSPKTVSAELAAKLGLKLVEARREVEVAEVRGQKKRG